MQFECDRNYSVYINFPNVAIEFSSSNTINIIEVTKK
jgi:hypothetical protein